MNLRNQILIPVSILFLLGTTAATWINVNRLVQNESRELRQRAADLFGILSETSFPLSDSVLRQVNQISGFQLVVQQSGSPLRSSFQERVDLVPILDEAVPPISGSESADRPALVLIGESQFFVFHGSLGTRGGEVWAFYPNEELTATTRALMVPQVVTALIIVCIMTVLIYWISSTLTKPIRHLGEHVKEIAQGNFQTIQVDRTDELGELFTSVNEMAIQLQDYEQKVRSQEKLMTLDQMSGGLAHQMKNSITGCRLALDYHRENCESDSESLDVAVRQLTHMENFQRRFLELVREPQTSMERTNLTKLIEDDLPLLTPAARHAKIDLQFLSKGESAVWSLCHSDTLRQALQNLVINAIEACSSKLIAADTDDDVAVRKNVVQIELRNSPEHDTFVEIVIRDNGPGPDPSIQTKLFEPLATTKPDGIGLGLAIVKQTVDNHGGEIAWNRREQWTEFVVRLPLADDN